MNDDIKQLDQSLDEILKRPIRNISDHLIENYTHDELHLMQRLLRQRRNKFIKSEKDKLLFNHYISFFELARAIVKTQNSMETSLKIKGVTT